MARPQIPAPAGLTEILQILNVLTHPEEHAKKLHELEVMRKEINEGIRKIGIKGDVDQLLASAKVKSERAQSLLDEASAKSSKELEDAKAEAKRLIEEANLSSEHIHSEAGAIRTELERRKVELDQMAEAVRLREEQVASEMESLRSERQIANDLRNEYQVKLDQLEGALKLARGSGV